MSVGNLSPLFVYYNTFGIGEYYNMLYIIHNPLENPQGDRED